MRASFLPEIYLSIYLSISSWTVEVVRGPVGKRRSIMTTVPAHGDLSPRARIYFFVFVVHTMSTMAGAMQFSRG